MKNDDILHIYDTRYCAPFSGESYESAIEKDIFIVRELLPSTNQKFICDLCCGLGFHMIKLAETSKYTVEGVDFSPEAYKKYQAKYGYLKNPKYHCCPMFGYSNQNKEKFDAVLCYLPHLDSSFHDNTKDIFYSIWNLCKKGGISIISFLCSEFAPQMVSNNTIYYDKKSPIPISSLVTFDTSNKLLKIKQKSQAWQGEIVEKMHLYTIQEIKNILIEIGFIEATSLNEINKFKDISHSQRILECKSTLICTK